MSDSQVSHAQPQLGLTNPSYSIPCDSLDRWVSKLHLSKHIPPSHVGDGVVLFHSDRKTLASSTFQKQLLEWVATLMAIEIATLSVAAHC